MRIPVTVIIEMTDEQLADYAEWAELELTRRKMPRARDMRRSIRGLVLTSVTNIMDRVGSGGQVSIKDH
jgi:hypothetical protein